MTLRMTQTGPKTLTRVMIYPSHPTAVANGETTRTDRDPPSGRGPGAAAAERMRSERAADSELGVDRAKMVVGATGKKGPGTASGPRGKRAGRGAGKDSEWE